MPNVGSATLKWWKERIDQLTREGLGEEAYALYMEFTSDGCELQPFVFSLNSHDKCHQINSRHISCEMARSDGWTEVGNSGLVYRPCHPSSNNASLGKPCSLPSGNPKWWIGYELYCLDTSCQGRMEITIGDQEGIEKRFDYGTVLMFAREKRTAFADSEKNQVKFGLTKAAGFCADQGSNNWKKC